jgi:glycosyltransferase involved in cell wall biosynthesis
MPVHGPGGDEMMREWTKRSVGWADAVIALSENTRRDVEALGVPAERIRVIYGGGRVVPEDQIRHDRADEMRQALGLPERYILFVGTLQPRKNVPFLVRSFARLKQETGLPHRLVLAGHRDTAGDEVEALAKSLGIASDVIITGYVESWHLPLLYKGADVFVLPTRYEGFTLVTLEAMTYGTPVIATDTSSIREGVGDAALLVPVDDDAALAAAMRSVLTDPQTRAGLVDRGRARAGLFTWENCARETLALYRDLHAGTFPQAGARSAAIP